MTSAASVTISDPSGITMMFRAPTIAETSPPQSTPVFNGIDWTAPPLYSDRPETYSQLQEMYPNALISSRQKRRTIGQAQVVSGRGVQQSPNIQMMVDSMKKWRSA